MAAEVLGVASSVIAIVDMSFKIIHLVGRYMSGVRGAKEDMRNVIAELTECHTAADEMDKLLKNPRAQSLLSSLELASTLDPARLTLKELQTMLEASSNSSLGSLKWPQLKDSVEETVKRLSRTRERMLFLMNVDQTRQGQNIEHRIVIDNLPIAEGAAFDSHAQEHSTTCLPDTRVELLKKVSQWIESPDSRAIFWLNGMAGTGKSTISQSVARCQSEAGQLGASFFFKKGEAGRSSLIRFMSTLARQLADGIPGVGPLIKIAVNNDPAIGGKLIQQQFDKLIMEPLASFLASPSGTSPARIVFVIDALDECENDADIRLLIQVITSATSLRSHLRFFLTSRPNLPVRLGFKKAKDAYQDLVLHEMPESIVEHDLTVFFRINFDSIRLNFNTLVDNDAEKILDGWPGDDTLRELVSRSKPLFIFAATLCRFVNDANFGNPKALLAKFLESEATGSHLSQTYGPILDSQLVGIPSHLRAGIIKDFALVVGSIVILAEPLGISSLAALLGESRDTVSDRLRLLHSILRVPHDDSPVRLLHLSFGDYLLDPGTQTEGAHQFYVDKDHAHRTVAERSIRLMREHPLRQNIAGLSYPGMQTSDVHPCQLVGTISPVLRYACRYWIHHLTSSQFHEHQGALVHDFLQVHFLHWCEAMSLLGHLGEAMNALRSLLAWIHPFLGEISEFLADAIRFLRSNFHAIGHAPLQIYSSALALSPSDSVIKMSFASHIPSWLILQPPMSKTWDACVAVLECIGRVHSMSFSLDSKRLMGVSYLGIHVWTVETGECEATLLHEEQDGGRAWSMAAVAFSHDSELVAASLGSTIQVWMLQTGNRFLKLEGNLRLGDEVRSMFFSADSSMLFFDSTDGLIRCWDLKSGACTVVLEPLDNLKLTYQFVDYHIQDLTPLVLAHDGKVGRIWDLTQINPTAQAPGQGVRLEGFTPSVTSVATSHNHARIVMASSDATVRCWNATTGELLKELPMPGQVSVTFCGLSQKLIAAATGRGAIYFWDIDTGQVAKKSPRRGIIRQLACSPNGRFLATRGKDAMIWDFDELRRQNVFTRSNHSAIPSSLVFLHDARVLVSSSDDGSVRVWDTETGNSEEIPMGHPLPRDLNTVSPDSSTFGRLWEFLGKSQGRICLPEKVNVWAVKFSKDSETLAVASCGNRPIHIQLWNVRTREKLQAMETFGGPGDSVNCIFFSDDSTMLAVLILTNQSGHDQGRIVVWDCLSGTCIYDILHEEPIASAIFLPNGKKLVAATSSHICLWDLETAEGHVLEQQQVYSGVTRYLALASSSDSKRLVLSTSSGLWIWDLETARCIAVLETPTHLWNMSVLPGDRALVTNAGIIPIDIKAAGPFPLKVEFKGLGYSDEGWITWDGQPWLWLPRLYRCDTWYGHVQVQGNKIAIGCESGEVLFFGIDGELGSVPGASGVEHQDG